MDEHQILERVRHRYSLLPFNPPGEVWVDQRIGIDVTDVLNLSFAYFEGGPCRIYRLAVFDARWRGSLLVFFPGSPGGCGPLAITFLSLQSDL